MLGVLLPYWITGVSLYSNIDIILEEFHVDHKEEWTQISGMLYTLDLPYTVIVSFFRGCKPL